MVDLHQPPGTLHREQRNSSFAISGADAALGEPAAADFPILVSSEGTPLLVSDPDPTLLSENDIQWLHYLCKKKYKIEYDRKTTENWFINTVLKSPLMFHPVRLANSFTISMLSCVPWLPNDFECHIVLCCADDGAMWEAVKLLRDSIRWGRYRKCKVWKLTSDTDNDFANIARRLGVTEISPRFSLEL